ncbi:MAG: class I SAM-dependent methyltransferase [Acidimicrobiia bacterium]|nr:class I SAM-dependent methyltransferase [Acidimicrobiia bacterium]
MDPERRTRLEEWTGQTISGEKDALLRRFADWLREEAIAAGGVGPGERDRVEDRHVLDSLAFAGAWRGRLPHTLVDLGSGSGLPALPLAILFPDSEVVAVDRSGRRCRLIRRASRILDLGNVTVRESDIADIDMVADVVVSRASLPPEQLHTHLARIAAPAGVAVVGGSHVAVPSVAGFTTMEVPPEVLDRAVWLLIMARP